MSRAIHSVATTGSTPAVHELAHKKVHMIGIGGAGMSGAAHMLLARHAIVSGSDHCESPILQQLSAAGATVCIGHDHGHLPADVDVVVASAAIPADNPELLAAKAQGSQVLKYAELIGALMASTTGIAVAGTHGKSTTTALTTFVCREAGLDPSFVVGAEVDQLGGPSGVGEGELFIVEACEFDRSFMRLKPRHAVVLNTEEDHLDYFEHIDQIIAAFADFAALVPEDGLVLLNRDDPHADTIAAHATGHVEYFGFDERSDWRACDLHISDGLPSFEMRYRGKRLGRASLRIAGTHNVSNALAAAALAHRGGAPLDAVLGALGRFRGAARRLTHRGRFDGIDLLDDYAHHPTEIRVTLEAVRQRYQPVRLYVVFQPHQLSRTRFFLQDFAESFQLADEVVVPDIYFVRDSETDRQLINSIQLVEQIGTRGGHATYIASFDAISNYLAQRAEPGDAVLTMGAGDVWKVADEMVSRLRNQG